MKKNLEKDYHRFCIVESDKKESFRLKGKIWIEGEGGTFFGMGRAELLEKIKEYGSISKAAQAMNISYKKAWDLVESMNKQAKSPLVITKIGGKGGGGAKLTPKGEEILRQFKKLYSRFKNFLEKEIKNFKF
ncbi:MAG: DNA-binding transcriptional regulator ModE [Thermodesulfobacterium sp.]|uniref:DNA-binding transcriptional regulator ModE n=1 Tax=Candidatus Thermodesulfobacterium syntrophicum TaxID=3060442 RepID=A0AAE3TFK3_9BACT|nr:DNA-binding transcriptional regulator ModE [Candidatus Thermodesulfobacterium syntrophicum]